MQGREDQEQGYMRMRSWGREAHELVRLKIGWGWVLLILANLEVSKFCGVITGITVSHLVPSASDEGQCFSKFPRNAGYCLIARV